MASARGARSNGLLRQRPLPRVIEWGSVTGLGKRYWRVLSDRAFEDHRDEQQDERDVQPVDDHRRLVKRDLERRK